jgi:hypothetical protein
VKGGEIFCLLFVSNVFPLSSHSVVQDIPNSTSILSHIVWPQFNFHIHKM